jgi:two-component system sensor histidine kinase TtrS
VSGHSIAGATPKGLGGWLIGYNELVENSVNVFGQSKVSYLGVQENIINAVLNDTVDVGIVRTGVIERLVSENKLTLSDLKIINPKKVNGFPYILSTSLYPEWAFVKTSHASKSIAKDIATTLLLMPPGSTAALARGYSEWVTPVDYQPIHSLMKKLRIGVYKNYGKVGFLQYVKDNLILSTLVVILLMVLMVTGLWISRLNHARLQQKYEQDIEHITRLNTMGEVVTGIAHELNQPLTAIATSAFASSRLIESGKYSTNKLLDIFDLISLQAEHAASVIRHMRKLSDKNQIEYSLVNINTRIEDVIALMQANIKDAHIELVLNLSDNIPAILVQPIQIDQVLLNLCKNAIDAMVENTHKRVLTISTKLVGSELEVSLEDTGSGIDQAMQDRLFESFATQKKDGMGMGLSISRSIIERHYGNLYLEETSEHGSIFKFTLPIKK